MVTPADPQKHSLEALFRASRVKDLLPGNLLHSGMFLQLVFAASLVAAGPTFMGGGQNLSFSTSDLLSLDYFQLNLGVQCFVKHHI